MGEVGSQLGEMKKMYDAEKILIEANALAQKIYPKACGWKNETYMMAVQNALKAMELEKLGYEGVIK